MRPPGRSAFKFFNNLIYPRHSVVFGHYKSSMNPNQLHDKAAS